MTTPTTTQRASLRITAVAAALVATTSAAWAATYTVNSAYDDGLDINPNFCLPGETCTLRAAIQLANQDAAADTIAFNINGGGPVTISPATALPVVTQPLTIDGYTQPGSSPNTLTVGNNALINVRIDGFFAGDTNGLVIQAPDSALRGLAVTRFGINGVMVLVNGAANARIAGNFIGTDGSGSAQDIGGNLLNGGSGIHIGNGAGSIVGGPAPSDRNVVLGSIGMAVVGNVLYTSVQGNYIGTDRSGNAPRNTGDGVTVQGVGSVTIKGNVIGALHNGVIINGASSSNAVIGNRIGVGEAGASIAGDGHGVWIGDPFSNEGPQNTFVGGANGETNTIAHWGGWGVKVEQKDLNVATPTQSNAIINNRIFSNTAGGIQLAGGANRGQAAPVFNGAVTTGGGVASAPVTLQGQPNTSYRLEFFTNIACHASGIGEGQINTGFIASASTDANGQYSGTVQGIPTNVGDVLTMTARLAATGDTSQFSACAIVASAGPAGTPPVMKPIGNGTFTLGQPSVWGIADFFTPTDGDAIVSYQLTGTLPPGMTFDPATGVLSGTPTATGSWALSGAAKDKDGTSNASTFSIIVQTAGGNGGNGGNPSDPGSPGGNVAAVPALNGAGMGLLSILLAGVGALRRRGHQKT